jgi:type IV pilus assembly protein PilE
MGHRRTGFSLIEVCVVTALAAILATVAWPALSAQLIKSRRADGTAALAQLELAQARFHAANGLYAADWRTLGRGVAAVSAQGLYRLEFQTGPGDGFTATARPLPGSPQTADRDCPALELRVVDGFALRGPDARCWSR